MEGELRFYVGSLRGSLRGRDGESGLHLRSRNRVRAGRNFYADRMARRSAWQVFIVARPLFSASDEIGDLLTTAGGN